MTVYELHERLTKHLFPPYSSNDTRFLALALAGEVGELCNLIKKEWRDGTQNREEQRDELADCRIYVELLARCLGIEGDKLDVRVEEKLKQVAEKHRHRLDTE